MAGGKRDGGKGVQGDVRAFMRLRRRVASANVASSLGRTKLRLGFRLLDRLGLATPDALDGATCSCPTARRAASPRPGASWRGRSGGGTAQRAFRLAKGDDADLEGVRAKWVARDGDVFLDPGPLSTAQGVAMAKFLLCLDRRP